MSNTPQTDALDKLRGEEFRSIVSQYEAMTALARCLERERDQLRWRASFNGVLALVDERDELRAKYADHHAEADRLTKENYRWKSEAERWRNIAEKAKAYKRVLKTENDRLRKIIEIELQK